MQSQDSLPNSDRMELDSVQISKVTDSTKVQKMYKVGPICF